MAQIMAMPGHGLNQTSCHICTLTEHPNLLPSPQDMVPCWVAHTQDPSPQGTMIWGTLPHPCVLFGPTQTLSGFGVSPSPWEANQDVWFLPHDCSTICTQGECLEENLALEKQQGGDFIPEGTRGAGLCVSIKSPAPVNLLCSLFPSCHQVCHK